MLNRSDSSWVADNWEAFDILFESKNQEEKSIAEQEQALKEALGVVKMLERQKPQNRAATNPVIEKAGRLRAQHRDFSILNDENGQPCVIIYNSKEGDPNLNLNKKARDEQGREVVCRHLSRVVAARRMKGYSEDLSTIEGIEKQPLCKEGDGPDMSMLSKMIMEENKSELEVLKLLPEIWASSYYNLFPKDRMAAQIYSISTLLASGEECSLLFEFVITQEDKANHVMALSIRHKWNGTYVVKFYDPNATNMHRLALCKDLKSIRLLNIDNLWDPITHDALKKVGSPNCLMMYSLKKHVPYYHLYVDPKTALEDVKSFSICVLLHKRGSLGEIGFQLLLSSLALNQDLSLERKRQFLLYSIVTAFKDASSLGDMLGCLSSTQFELLFDIIIKNPVKPIETCDDYLSLHDGLCFSPERREPLFYKFLPQLLSLIKTSIEFQAILRILKEPQKEALLDGLYKKIQPKVEEAIKCYQKAVSRFKPSLENPSWTSQITELREAKTLPELNAAVHTIHQKFLGRCTLLNVLEKTGVIKELVKLGYFYPSFNPARFFELRIAKRKAALKLLASDFSVPATSSAVP